MVSLRITDEETSRLLYYIRIGKYDRNDSHRGVSRRVNATDNIARMCAQTSSFLRNHLSWSRTREDSRRVSLSIILGSLPVSQRHASTWSVTNEREKWTIGVAMQIVSDARRMHRLLATRYSQGNGFCARVTRCTTQSRYDKSKDSSRARLMSRRTTRYTMVNGRRSTTRSFRYLTSSVRRIVQTRFSSLDLPVPWMIRLNLPSRERCRLIVFDGTNRDVLT